jgi:hypothetical protein
MPPPAARLRRLAAVILALGAIAGGIAAATTAGTPGSTDTAKNVPWAI